MCTNSSKRPNINISEFDYPLPTHQIAKYPLKNRDESKLLKISEDQLTALSFKDLSEILPTNSLLVFNNTKVVKARLLFRKPTGAQIELFCLEPYQPNDVSIAFQQTKSVEWQCMVGNLKKWKEGAITAKTSMPQGVVTVNATIVKKLTDGVVVKFDWDLPSVTFAELLESLGETPIPPYLDRKAEAVDSERYQTVYSKLDGSVAAPTAGLHFSEEVFKQLSDKGIKKVELTLHVGAGTFKPVKSESISEHEMHTEHFEANLEVLKKITQHNGPIIAVGTTSARTLESIYWAGVKIKENHPYRKISQWDGFDLCSSISMKESFQLVIQQTEKEGLKTFQSATTIIIVPSYQFRVIDGLITNFHQPKSTLLLLIAAMIGDFWKDAYSFALNHNFRFLSYGDSSLLRNPKSHWSF